MQTPTPTAAPPGRRRRAGKGWPARFLAALARLGCVSLAARAAGVGRQTAYDRQKADPAFAAAWAHAAAEAVDVLHGEAFRRAVDGVERPVMYRGKQVGTVRDYSDVLLIFLLKAADPAKYRDNYRVEHAGPRGGPVPAEAKVTAPGDAWAAARVDARLAELCVEGGIGSDVALPAG